MNQLSEQIYKRQLTKINGDYHTLPRSFIYPNSPTLALAFSLFQLKLSLFALKFVPQHTQLLS